MDSQEIPRCGPETPPGRVTRAQEGMLSTEAMLAGQASPFHEMVSAEITGPLDIARLRAVLAQATRRHAVLRTVFTRAADTGTIGCRVLADWRPAFIEQELPLPRPGCDLVDLVHQALTPAVPGLLLPFARPAVVFVLSRSGSERAVLSIVVHHAVLDGWSIGVLWEEITAGYAAPGTRPGQPAPGMDLLVEAERARLGRGATAERAAMLAGWPAVAQLPGDLERPLARTFAGHRLPFTLSAEGRTGAAELGRSLRVSRNVVLMAAWALVLSRRAALPRVLIGIPTIGRSPGPTMRVLGGATGLGVVACEVPEEGTVADFVRHVGQAMREALRYGNVPYEELVPALSAGPDQSRSPLVQFVFGAGSDVLPAGLPGGEVTFDIRVGHTGGTAYDAMLHMLRWGPSPELAIEYATSVLTAGEAMDLAASFDQALVELAADPLGPLAEVTTVTEHQRRRLRSWQEGPAAGTGAGLWQLIEAAATRQRDGIAVRDADPGRQLTYGQLRRAVESQSALLARAGVTEGDRVALALDRSAEEIVSILAVLRLGAAYVGLDADTPAAVTAAILDRAGAEVVLGDPGRLAALGDAGLGRLALPAVDPLDPPLVADVPPAALADPDRIAYLGFTSGTTGVPKGAMIPCRAVVRLVHHSAVLKAGASTRFLRLAPLAFDASTLEIFAPLLAGGTIEVYPGNRVTPNALAAFAGQRAVTGMWLTTGLFRLIADFRPDAFRSAVQLLTGGDVVPPAQVAAVLRACPGLRVTIAYGPTENTTFTTVHHLDDQAASTGPALPIGTPIEGTGVLVLDHGRLVPPGGIGELYAYGEGLARGYAGMPAETARGFGEFGRGDDRRLYRTGDLVRWDSRGRLQFLGRRDRQVKVRGFRVEPEQVAVVLRQHPEVRDAVVVAVPLGYGDHQILAAVSPVSAVSGPRGGGMPDTLRSYAARHLPGYAQPGLWAVAESFPVTRNGKLDIAKLMEMATPAGPGPARPGPAEPGPAEPGITPSAAPAAGPGLEAAIARAWQAVLGHRDFEESDWFFDVGGDSLKLIEVQAVLASTQPDWNITVGDLYSCPTIAELADKLRAEADERTASHQRA